MEKEITEAELIENGKKYKELLTKLLSNDYKLDAEAFKQVSGDIQEAVTLCNEGIDDVYAELTYEVIKKAYYSEGIGFIYVGFIRRYIDRCIKSFSDKISKLQPILDFMNTNMKSESFAELLVSRKELDKLIYNKYDGFQFVLITDELRDKMRWFINDKKILLNPLMDWLIGVYEKESGMFITQIKGTLPGREVFERIYKYVVFTDDGISFMFSIMTEPGKEDVYILPAAYGSFENKLKEGIALYKQRLMYYFSLSKDITDKLDGIIDNMHDAIENNRI